MIGWINVDLQCFSSNPDDCYFEDDTNLVSPRLVCYSGGNTLTDTPDDETTAHSCQLRLAKSGESSEEWVCVEDGNDGTDERCNLCQQCRCDDCPFIEGIGESPICDESENKDKKSIWSKSSSSSKSWEKSSS